LFNYRGVFRCTEIRKEKYYLTAVKKGIGNFKIQVTRCELQDYRYI